MTDDTAAPARVPLAACPLCGEAHERCQFTAGSLYCVREDCPNPHHRTEPDE